MTRFSTAGLISGLASSSFLFADCLAASSFAQVSPKAPATDASSSAQRGISLAVKGRCQEALPILKKAAPHLADKQLKYRALMATARCAMSLDQTETAVEALLVLNREFPHDPDVLYSTTHFYSELASRAAQELAATAPTSHQANNSRRKPSNLSKTGIRAIAEYKKILEQEPNLAGHSLSHWAHLSFQISGGR